MAPTVIDSWTGAAPCEEIEPTAKIVPGSMDEPQLSS